MELIERFGRFVKTLRLDHVSLVLGSFLRCVFHRLLLAGMFYRILQSKRVGYT